MLYHVFNQEKGTKDGLPLKVQAHLWHQLWNILRSDDEKFRKSACIHLERLIRQNRAKELKSTAPDVFSEFKSIPRWVFIKGSLPYVIQCVATILGQFRMVDKPSGEFTKLSSTLDWIVLESFVECPEANSSLDLSTIELFIQSLIPYLPTLSNVNPVICNQLWHPLCNHLSPRKSLLALPVICSEVTRNGSTESLDSTTNSQKDGYMITTYFDVAVMKVMMLENWTQYSYRWGLQYLQNLLQNFLVNQGFDLENCSVLKAMNRLSRNRVVSQSLSEVEYCDDSDLDDANKIDEWFWERDGIKIPVNQTLPDSLLLYVSQDGSLKLPFFIELLKKLVKNNALYQMAGSLLFVLEQIVEISIDDKNLLKTIMEYYPSLLYCQMNIIKMFGCEHHCGIGIKAVKGDQFRSLAHEYLNRLLSADPQIAKRWFQKYAESEELGELLQIMHSLIGFCDMQPLQNAEDDGKHNQNHKSRSTCSSEEQQRYAKDKISNETRIISWVAPFIYKNMTKVCKGNVDDMIDEESFACMTHFTKYIQMNYSNVFRRLVLSGILDSFSKISTPVHESSRHQDPMNGTDLGNTITSDGSNTSPMSQKGVTNGKPSVPNQESHKNGRNLIKKKIRTMIHSKEFDSGDTSFGSPPLKAYTLPHAKASQDFSIGFSSSSLPKDSSNVFSDSIIDETDLSATAKVDERTKRGKNTNLYALYHGLKELRCLLNLVPPGTVPDETVVGALMDLEAPALARGAYLLELAYFVHCCNNDEWPAMFNVSQQHLLKGYNSTNNNAINVMKHQAGVLFHGWGVALGKKIDQLINDEGDRCYANDTPINLLYQGDRETISWQAPPSLRFAACQLLKEITAYLRETHTKLISTQTIAASDSPLPTSSRHVDIWEATANSNSPRRPKQSIATSLSKKIIEVRRRKSSAHLLATVTSSNPEKDTSYSPTRSPARVHRNKSLKTSKSPKFARKFSRQVSAMPLSNEQPTNYGALFVDNNETSEFPWLDVLILMNKSINFLCVHSSDKCPDSCPLQQMKACNELMHGLKLVYDVAVLEGEEAKRDFTTIDMNKKNIDVVYKYILEQVGSLYQVPFSVLCKGVFVMENGQLADTMAASWEVLLYPDEKLKSVAACLFLVTGLRLEATISNFLTRELTCDEAEDRAKAIQRFSALWEYQDTVYDHLENSTKNALKVPVPRLDYTLPSRMIGESPDNLLVPDAPWDPEDQLMNELDLSDDEVTAYFHDSEKQKELKMLKKKKKLKRLKDQYSLLSVPLVYQASLDSWIQDEDEFSAAQSTVPVVQQFFPPAMSTGIVHLIRLLDDKSIVVGSNQAVGDIAYQMIWKALVDNPTTFFRRFFEKITRINKQEELILLLRKLLLHMSKLPGHAAYALFNNLIGIISYYDRTNRPGYQDRMAEIMPLLWQVVPSVSKIYFTDMKQSLRREHVDNVLMATANVGGVKELMVSHLRKSKESLSVMDEMMFKDLLVQMKAIFELETDNYWLVDKHSGMIMENNTRIRDVYVFKRGFPCPVLKVEELADDFVAIKRQEQAKTGKLLSISQLMLTMSIFDVLPNKKHVMFLYAELYHQASFPRRAIDVEFDLYNYPQLGKEINGLDAIFKDKWIKFVSKLLMHLSELHTFDEDMIGLFLDPINGAILLHCEDVMVLRSSIAALINVAKSYGKKFANDGYYTILPTIFRVYSNHEKNMLVKQTLEFAIAKFYRLHGSPFILQMFACVAPILMTDDMADIPSEQQSDLIPARCVFAMLESLEREIADDLDIMSLVQGEKPIKPYDNVLDEHEENKLDLSIRLALTVIAYKSESVRALQMMFVLSAIIPYYLRYLESATEAKPDEPAPRRKEERQIKRMIKYVAIIIEQNETLVHGYRNEGSITSDHSQDAASSNGVSGRLASAWNALRNWFSHAGELIQEGDELERACIFEDGENPIVVSPTNLEEKKALEDFYQPRTVLLTLASEFTLQCTKRYVVLNKDKEGKGRSETKFSDIVEEENAYILIDVAMSMLKLVFYDHTVLQNPGLQRFILEAMPSIRWSGNLEAFTVIVKSVKKVFGKCLHRPEYMRFVNWPGLEILIRGIYLSLKKDQEVADVKEIRDLIHACTRLMIGDFNNTSCCTPSTGDAFNDGMKSPCTIEFNTTVIKLMSKLLSVRSYEYNIQANFACYVQHVESSKVERFLVHWLLPLCIRMGTGRYDMPSMNSDDICFVITVLMTLLSPDKSFDGNASVKGSLALMTSVTVGRQLIVTQTLSKICFLGFKILLTVFNETFKTLWKSLKTSLINYMDTFEADYSFWLFVSHIVCNRSPILMHLLPVIRKKLSNTSNYPDKIQRVCKRIKKDLANPPVISSRSLVLKQLLNDLSILATSDEQQPDAVDETDDPHVQEVDSEATHTRQQSTDSPARNRQLSTEEDDESYIQRIKTEMRKSGRHVPSKQSIMRHPKEHPKIRKQVSFQAGEEDGALTPKGSPSRSLTSPKRKKLSKRSKLRIFKRQASTEREEKENIIPNESVDGDDAQPMGVGESDEEGGGEHSDNTQSRPMEDDNDNDNLAKKAATTMQNQIATQDNPITAAMKLSNKSNSLLSITSGSDDEDGLAARTLSLSRSPGVRRRYEAGMKISGMSFENLKENPINKNRSILAKSQNVAETPQLDSNTVSTPALDTSSSLPPASSESDMATLGSADLSPKNSSEKLDKHAGHTVVEGDTELPSVFKRVPLVKHQRQFVFDRTETHQSTIHNAEKLDEKDAELSAIPSYDQEAPLVSPTIGDKNELSPKKVRSPRRLPKLPRFDETRLVEMKRKISEGSYSED